MTKVASNDFVREYQSIKKEVDSAVTRVLESGWFILGKEGQSFESEFASFLGAKYCVGVASGTDALTIALLALGLGEGDEVILPANVYPSAFGVHRSGVKICLADVDPETLIISADAIEKAITKKTKAIVIVYLYGTPANISRIQKIAKQHKLFLIEDCAQATGAMWKNKKVGNFGDISCFSFYPTKNLGAYGDGGAVVTNSKKLYEKVKLWRMYGERGRYDSQFAGMNSRLDELQAAILRAKLKFVVKWNKKRNELVSIYKKKLQNVPVAFLNTDKDAISAYHLLVIKCKERDRLYEFLRSENIGAGIHYPKPIHLTKAFANLGYKKGDFPITEKSSSQILSLPIFPQLTVKEVEYVCKKIKQFYQ